MEYCRNPKFNMNIQQYKSSHTLYYPHRYSQHLLIFSFPLLFLSFLCHFCLIICSIFMLGFSFYQYIQSTKAASLLYEQAQSTYELLLYYLPYLNLFLHSLFISTMLVFCVTFQLLSLIQTFHLHKITLCYSFSLIIPSCLCSYLVQHNFPPPPHLKKKKKVATLHVYSTM